jgi:UDPglucose 6-dehydrogenase
MAESMRVVIVGTGYVGLTTGVCLAYLGHHVTCVDKDPEKIALLERGKSPIHEHGMEEVMSLAASRLAFAESTPQVWETPTSSSSPWAPRANPPGRRIAPRWKRQPGRATRCFRAGRTYMVVIKFTVSIGINSLHVRQRQNRGRDSLEVR